MDKQNIEHIEDDFLKGLLKLSDEEKPSENFTQLVMAKVPKPVVMGEEEKIEIKPWHWVTIAAALVGAVYFIITFNLNSLFRQVTDVSEGDGINYLNMFTSIIQLFAKTFSGFHFTSITLMIVISGLALYFGDMFLRKWPSNNVVVV
ncbi:MAG: hypothetical protein B6I19_07930 [Bacteroidetes bacterium 4572_114]|nr:MAG: hypothetical protein B6I19_07930 [Bacteroidetes bacterium 4572_114]